jgi:hypothetical protein
VPPFYSRIGLLEQGRHLSGFGVYQACGLFSTTPALNTTAKAARNASRFADYSAQGRIALTKGSLTAK